MKRYQRRAKSVKFCDYCGREIAAGAEYVRYVYPEQENGSNVMHIHCDAIWDGYERHVPDAAEKDDPFTEMRAWIWENICTPHCGGAHKCSPWRCMKVAEHLVKPAALQAVSASMEIHRGG